MLAKRTDASMLGVRGKAAIVTGAGRNIGREIARLLARAGCQVAVVDISGPDAASCAKSIRAERGSATAFTADVCDPAAVDAMVKEVARGFGKIDILVNNAAWTQAPSVPVHTIPVERWDRMQQVTLRSAFLCMRAVAPLMRHNGSARIVNISSVVFWLGMAGCADYVAAKAGIIGLTRSAARDLGPWKINVNAITPGAVKTPQEKHIATAADLRKIVEAQCLGRRVQTADIAGAVLFLCSDLSSAITGQTLNVDAGWMMH